MQTAADNIDVLAGEETVSKPECDNKLVDGIYSNNKYSRMIILHGLHHENKCFIPNRPIFSFHCALVLYCID